MESVDVVSTSVGQGQRGPAEHEKRAQILRAAEEHFRLYGYRKTTIADLAKAINFSTGYIYKFFDSKQSIGEAICTRCLTEITSYLEATVMETASPVECMRRVFRGLAVKGTQLFFDNRKMHDIVAASFEERWGTLQLYNEALLGILRTIVLRGRESGEFERKTPLEETLEAIIQTTYPFFHPVFLEQNFENIEEKATAVANLVLRSLAI